MKNLKAELESGVTYKREEPFIVRSFKPYLQNKWIGNAVAYGCYRTGQAPGLKSPSDAELLEDLILISKYWNMIRTYGADKDTKRILKLIADNNIPIKVVQGIWLSPIETKPEHRANNNQQVLLGIELANQYPDIITALCVGNETQVYWSNNKVSPDIVINYIRAVRNNVAVPVTTADDHLYWNTEESKTIAQEIDFIFTHIHPLWNGQSLDNAIDWLDSIYNEHREMHTDVVIVIGETGWATQYDPDNVGPGNQGTLIKGDVSLDAQATFLENLNTWVASNKITTFLFEAFDESWKGENKNSPSSDIEKNWGVFYENRTPKESFLKFLKYLA